MPLLRCPNDDSSMQSEVDTFHRDPEAWRRSHPYDDDYNYRKKKNGGFDLFDIFD